MIFYRKKDIPQGFASPMALDQYPFCNSY